MVTGTPKMSTHPKSLFNFNRRHLFKLSASDMMKGLQQVLYKLNIRFHNADVFTLSCECDDWRHLIIDEGISENAMTTLRFTIMAYQARWANGRLGVKLIEAEDENSKIYRSIYHAILNELSLKYTQ
jgi:hypothetical protein